jgi:hypothetical protein
LRRASEHGHRGGLVGSIEDLTDGVIWQVTSVALMGLIVVAMAEEIDGPVPRL